MARELSVNHLKEYLAGGKFHKLFSVVQEDPELSFEIRTKDEVIIYYSKKAIATISRGKKVKALEPNYYKGGEGPNVDISKEATWRSVSLIRNYFKQAKDIVYKHSKKTEFAVQQNISLGSRSFDHALVVADHGLVVVDMEWQFSQAGLSKRINRTRIDLVAIDSRPNTYGYNDVYLVEVKHSLASTGGESGLQDHIDKTNEIINCSAACNALNEDVLSIIEQKMKLGILKGAKPELKLSPKPKMMFFLSYRSEEEKTKLEKQVAELKIPQDMDVPAVQYHNYTIQLSL